MFCIFKNHYYRVITKKKRKKLEKEIANRINTVICSVQRCGNALEVFGDVEIFSGENITIGDHCKLNTQVILNGRSGIKIGNNVTISPGAKILSTGYDLERFFNTGERIHFSDKPIIIGNHCWLGAGAIVLPGVQITGEYVVVGAGAVVTKDISESRVIVAGNPARIIKRVE